jgi:prolyl-tRNA editing enzyme YbaK/EbsC (Cys-tRNA(Pro) deacylase)
LVASRERVAEYLSKSGAEFQLRDFDESTKNSSLAARVLGCTVAEIAKSVVFVGRQTVVVVISGDRRVDQGKLARATGEALRIAKPDEVRTRTRYTIGGVPPFPHDPEIVVFLDESLERFDHVWAAAGTPNSVFRIGTRDLLRLVGRGSHDLAEQR